MGEVDAQFGHGCHDGGVDVIGGCGAGRPDQDLVACMEAQECGGHLGAASVVHADEQHLRNGGLAVGHELLPSAVLA